MKKMLNSKKGYFIFIPLVLGFAVAIGILLIHNSAEGLISSKVGKTSIDLIKSVDDANKLGFYLQSKAKTIYIDSLSELIERSGQPIFELNKKPMCRDYASTYKEGIKGYELRPFWQILGEDCFPVSDSLSKELNEKFSDSFQDHEIVIGDDKIYGIPLRQNNIGIYFTEDKSEVREFSMGGGSSGGAGAGGSWESDTESTSDASTEKNEQVGDEEEKKYKMVYYFRAPFSVEIDYSIIAVFKQLKTLTSKFTENVTECLGKGGEAYTENDMGECILIKLEDNSEKGNYSIKIKEHNFDGKKKYFTVLVEAKETTIKERLPPIDNDFVQVFGVLMEDKIPPPAVKDIDHSKFGSSIGTMADGISFSWEKNFASDTASFEVSCTIGGISFAAYKIESNNEPNMVEKWNCNCGDTSIYECLNKNNGFKANYGGASEVSLVIHLTPLDFNGNKGQIYEESFEIANSIASI